MSTSVLVVAQHTALRAAVARVLVPLGCRVEIASNEIIARKLLAKERFDAAVVATASRAGREAAFLGEVKDVVDRLVVLADDANVAQRCAASFPEALVCSSRPLQTNKLSNFLSDLKIKKASGDKLSSSQDAVHFAGCTLDMTGRVFLDANRQEVALTRREFDLLVVFVSNPGRVLSRAQLRDAIDGRRADAFDRSVDMLVMRLRRKIEREAPNGRFIVTVPGTGYKFLPRVRAETALPAASLDTPVAMRGAGRDTPRAERRQLTVLSCQILGFAALAAKLDPEDLEQSIGNAYAACAEVIARYGGTMERSLGDTVLAYFGHPDAHENDAERAVRAALELPQVIGGIKVAPIGNLRARIGVATSLMVVGELNSIGGRDLRAVGEALNLAQHLQKVAPAEGVVIAASTRDLIGRLFRCCEIAAVEMEEGHERLPAWRVIEEMADMSRFEAMHRDGMLDLVGRGAEIERLGQCWSQVLRGSGQVVLLMGEAGIGKSRLVIELQARLSREAFAAIRYSCSPHRANAPMAVLIDELQRSAGFAPSDAAGRKEEKLHREFTRHGPAATDAVPLACTLLGLPCEASPEIRQLSPQKRKERTFATLLSRIEAMASRQPVFAVVEDIHWADPTSLEFFAMLVERASALRLLLIIVARPEFVPPWPEHSYVTTLALPRLSRSDSIALTQQVAGDRRLPTSVEADVVARADGVPLFVEELTKSVLEHGANGSNGAIDASGAGVALIPTTLRALLLMRFDRLERGKEVAQAGAVIGREFSFELLRMITSMDETVLRADLDQLVASGLIFRRGALPQATFVFKHRLMRDAAYDMLLRATRRKLHANVARCYEESFAETAEAQPELLAYHFREAGNPIRSIHCLLVAAEGALLRSASTEALAHLAEARELAVASAEDDERLQLELQLEITLARALLATRGYTAPETREAYRRARNRCEALGDQASLPLIIHGQWLGAWMAADHPSALEEAQRLYVWGERHNDQVGLAIGHADLGMSLTTLGRLVDARRHLDLALQINNFVLPGRQPLVASDADGRISVLSFLHNCLLLLGFPDQAKVAAAEAGTLNAHNLYSRGLAQIRILRMCVLARDVRTAAELAPGVVRLSQEQGYPHLASTAMIYAGWAMAHCGDISAGIASCECGLAQLQGIGAKCWLPMLLALLAECYEQLGDRKRSTAAIEQALQHVEASDERIWEAEIYRLKGTLLARSDDVDGAASCFAIALQTARAQRAKLLELRAAVSLAGLLHNEHRPAEARMALGPVYASFTEGFDFIDLREAKSLLDALGD